MQLLFARSFASDLAAVEVKEVQASMMCCRIERRNLLLSKEKNSNCIIFSKENGVSSISSTAKAKAVFLKLTTVRTVGWVVDVMAVVKLKTDDTIR